MSWFRARWRLVAIGVVLGGQILTVAYGRTTDTRYLAWAPYDQISFYEVEVEIDGDPLTADQVVARYTIGLFVDDGVARGRENRAIAHVHTYLQRAEADTDGVEVIVRASVNGGPVEVWTWSR